MADSLESSTLPQRAEGHAGAVVGLTTPLLLLTGDTTDTIVSNTAIIGYTVAAVVWTRHALRVPVPRWQRLPGAVLAAGLLIASSGFFFAIGAAIATVGAAGHGAVLLSRADRRQRHLGSTLALTAVAVVIAALIGDVTSQGGFAATMVVFAGGIASATASLGIRPTTAQARPDPQATGKDAHRHHHRATTVNGRST